MKIAKPFSLCSRKIKFLPAENREKLISAQPRISAHPKRQNISLALRALIRILKYGIFTFLKNIDMLKVVGTTANAFSSENENGQTVESSTGSLFF